jgi:glycosyltransferase involved in cell wall biosynthesis
MSFDPKEQSVSVVVPAYNARRTLPATVASIESQTVRPLELIVVDDGSSDDTAEVARSTGASNLRVIPQPNAGHAAARNTGITAARGRYVAFLDADDLWLPAKLERQLDAINRDPEIRALHTGAARIDDELRLLWTEPCGHSEDQLWDTLYFRNLPALMSTLMVERELLDEVGGFDPSLVILQDWDIAIRLAQKGQLHSIPDVLSAYRYYGTSQSADVDIHVKPGLRVLEKAFADPQLPPEIRAQRRRAYARFYAMLCGGSIRIKSPRSALYWGLKALWTDPRVVDYIAAFPRRRLARRRRAAELPPALPFPAAVVEANIPTQPRLAA